VRSEAEISRLRDRLEQVGADAGRAESRVSGLRERVRDLTHGQKVAAALCTLGSILATIGVELWKPFPVASGALFAIALALVMSPLYVSAFYTSDGS
jgi:hypothetical protein